MVLLIRVRVTIVLQEKNKSLDHSLQLKSSHKMKGKKGLVLLRVRVRIVLQEKKTKAQITHYSSKATHKMKQKKGLVFSCLAFSSLVF
jgi:hypothetical protein